MKIAIFGGSFNPIHNAHVKLVQRFVDEVFIDKAYFVPTNITPLKDNTDIVSPEHRLNMCKIALSDYPYFSVSDVEIKREGTSYSCDTIAFFKALHPDAQLHFIMGADMFLTLEKWKNFEYIFDNITILTAPRDDCSYDELVAKFDYYQKYGCKAYITTDYIEELSSTFLRNRIRNSLNVSAYLDEKVIAYINEHKLYR